MFLRFVIIGFLTAVSCYDIDQEPDSTSDIYAYIVDSLKDLKYRQIEEDALGAPTSLRAPSVCYDELGCFDKNGTFRHLKQLPEPPENIDTQFLLYTRKNPMVPQIIDYKKPETVLESNIDPKLPLKIMTHGFGGRNNLTWLFNMKNAFIKMEEVNIIVVDWSIGARTPYYIQACINTELIGAQIAVMYYFIKDNLGIMEKDLHVIGFSLGAQVVGFVGKRMMMTRGTRPAKITGLDPASPLFEDYGGEVHIYKEDADHVDVVHTNADLLIYAGVGMGQAVGHVDYYPNGGKRQPGCGSTIKGAFIDIFKGDRKRACNHERAVHLFIESILHPTSCKFTSFPCSNYSDFAQAKCYGCHQNQNCGIMGYKGHGSGTYYLMTKGTEPFCADAATALVRYSKGIKKSYGSITLTLVGSNDDKENITITSEKDEKLINGTEKRLASSIGYSLRPIKRIEALYIKYNGWIVKGTDTFSLDTVILSDAMGKTIFQRCGEAIILNDSVPTILTQSKSPCS